MRRKTHILPFLLIFLAPLLLRAQDPMNFSYRPLWPDHFSGLQHCIAFSGEYSAGSDAITNSFLNSLYQGGYLDSATKAEQESHLLASNRLGLYAGYSAAYSWRNKPDSLRWELSLALRDRQSLFGRFSDDAFLLVFEGNRHFLGQTADISGMKFTYLHWQQLQFEAKYYSPDRRSEAVIGFSLLNGQQMNQMNLNKGTLFTASDGTFIDASAESTYYSSDTAALKYMSRNGSGTCFNFRFSTTTGDSASKFRNQVLFSVQDLGYIRWNSRSLIYHTDTSLHYTGIDITEMILNDTTPAGIPDSDSLIGKPVNGQVITFLPVGLRLRYALLTPWPWWGGVDFRVWSYSESIPQVTLFGGWHSPDFRWTITGGAAWGGYARLQIPLQVSWKPCKNFSLTAGAMNIAGYILPAKTRGQGAFANLSFAF